MSYNVDTIQIIEQFGFKVSVKKLREFRDELASKTKRQYWPPEGNPFDEAENLYDEEDMTFYDGTFPWYGEGSGSSFHYLIDLLAIFDGHADMIVTWEGGDEVEGIRVADHKVTVHEVVYRLSKEIKGAYK